MQAAARILQRVARRCQQIRALVQAQVARRLAQALEDHHLRSWLRFSVKQTRCFMPDLVHAPLLRFRHATTRHDYQVSIACSSRPRL